MKCEKKSPCFSSICAWCRTPYPDMDMLRTATTLPKEARATKNNQTERGATNQGGGRFS